MTTVDRSRRLRGLKVAWIATWAALLLPLAVLAAHRVASFQPRVTSDDVRRWLMGPERTVLVDFRRVDGGRGRSLAPADGSRGATTRIRVPPFGLAGQAVGLTVIPGRFDGTVTMTLREADGDAWVTTPRPVAAGRRPLVLLADLRSLRYEPTGAMGGGLTDVVEVTVEAVGRGSLTLRDLAIQPAEAPRVLLIPTAGDRALQPRVGPPAPKPDGVVRVALLGDSMVYGVGAAGAMPAEQTFAGILQTKLDIQRADREVQVLNFAMPGLNTAQEVALYEEAVRAHHPDLLLVFFYRNDVEDGARVASIAQGLRDSARYRYLYEALGDPDLVQQLIHEEAMARYLDEGPAPTMDGVIAALRRLDELTRADGVPVGLVLLWDSTPDQVRALVDLCRDTGWPYLDLGPMLGRYGPRRLYLDPDSVPADAHPSVFAHQRIAAELAAFVPGGELVAPRP